VNNEERELKLTPRKPTLLDELWDMRAFGPFEVLGRRIERQRNSFFDTRERALRRARIGFRRRVIHDQPLAVWTIKGEGSMLRGISTRTEIELRLDADTPPALAIGVLRQAAQQRGAAALAEQLGDALSSGSLPLREPVLETENQRRVLELAAAEHGWQTEMTLDDVRIVGHPGYIEQEIEVELQRGGDDALDAARAAIEAVGGVRESEGSKLSRALAHVERCDCAPSPSGRGSG
jgi:inorganic triphosphatase YgiF